ncbi:MAG: metallophosphoesterase family protein [Myxococcales bacterium]|nr:metallophosphoesterase family protein [Myxococcales bacterium]
MRVAVIADIHGNVPALEAVLADLETHRPDEVVVAGDLVGRGPEGDRVCSIISELGWQTIRGNHEDYLLGFRHRKVSPDWLSDPNWAWQRFLAAELSEANVEFISSLPLTTTSKAIPELRVFHGSPQSYTEGIGSWTDERTLESHWDAVEEDVLVVAHTHRPLEKRVRKGLIVNVGSVGLPFNGDYRAQYAVFDREAGALSVTFRQVEYDREAVRQAYQASGFLDAGGIQARLLLLEIEHARSFLVPFSRWAEHLGETPSEGLLTRFLEFFDPHASLKDLIRIMSEAS